MDIAPRLLSRFDLRRLLGAGGMGMVYEAYDTERGDVVALKLMRRVTPVTLYHFKREFRTLADLQHPNLVTLYELLRLEDVWAFTMELIRGVSFLAYVRGFTESQGGAEPRGDGDPSSHGISANDATETCGVSSPSDTTYPTRSSSSSGRVVQQQAPTGLLAIDEKRLRSALAELATGVHALHQFGFLHRDIKPSNTLVASDGRVVLCDFGLIGELDDSRRSASRRVTGTLAYMAPEQAEGGSLSPASDWYGVGVLLYQVLTGRIPFVGSAAEILWNKRHQSTSPPQLLNPCAPADLCALCTELLRPDPGSRPTGQDVLAQLGIRPPPSPPTTQSELFVGREPELAFLAEAFRGSRAGAAVIVFISGTSGVGKSALMQHFLTRTLRDNGALVFSARCYEREAVPYKAFDAIVDGLATHLADLSASELDRLAPADLIPLVRVFPVLGQVWPAAEGAVLHIRDAHEQRRRAFLALRELLANLARGHPVVLAIEDLQCRDIDSERLLRAVLDPPQAPPVMLVANFRGEDWDRSPFLGALLAQAEPPGQRDGSRFSSDVRILTVEPLGKQDADRLAVALLGPSADQLTRLILVREAEGSPFFLGELARAWKTGAAREDLTLGNVLRFRVARLPEPSRRLLTIVAVAGRPIALSLAAAAAGPDLDLRNALAGLRAGHLVTTTGERSEDPIDVYHGRIRESVLGRLNDEQLRSCHEALARAYESRMDTDLELLAGHWAEAGRRDNAGHYAARAADRASQALAFDKAARLYQLAIDHGAPDANHLKHSLAKALTNAGRGAEAAEVYWKLASGDAGSKRDHLRRLAAQQWLYTGHLDKGLAAIEQLLASLRLRIAPTPRRAIASLAWQRARLRLRGYGYHIRGEGELNEAELARVDTLWSVSSALSVIDTIRGAALQTRHVRAALSCGEPYRLSRGLAMEAGYLAAEGARQFDRAHRLAREALAFAEDIRHPHAVGFAHVVIGTIGYLTGRWTMAAANLRTADEFLRHGCRGVTWERTVGSYFLVISLWQLGELRTVERLLAERIRDADERGDRYGSNALRCSNCSIVWLALDRPADLANDIEYAQSIWRQDGFQIQHWQHFLCRAQLDLYSGDVAAAWRRIESTWKPLSRSLLLRVQTIRVETLYLRACAALAYALRGGPGGLVRRAAKDARLLDREGAAWASARATLLRAALAHWQGKIHKALAGLSVAESAFRSCDMQLMVAICRYRRGELVGDEDGDQLRRAAERELRALGVAKPESLLAVLAPGFAPTVAAGPGLDQAG